MGSSNRFFRMAFRNVRTYWRQSLAALLSVLAAFVSFVIFEGYLQDIYRAYTSFNDNLEMFGDFIIEKKGASEVEGRSDPWSYSLTPEDQALLQDFLSRHQEKLETIVRFLHITGSIDTANRSMIFQGKGYDVMAAAQMRRQWRWDTYWGKPLHESKNPDQQMIVGLRLAQKLECLPHAAENTREYLINLKNHPHYRPFLCESKEYQLSAMTERGPINAIDLSVSGIQDKGYLELDSRFVVMSLAAAQRLFNTQKISYLTLRLKAGVPHQEFLHEFHEFTQKQAPHLSIMPWQAHTFGEMYRKTLSLLNIIRIFLIGILVFVGAMSVFNTLVKMVKERTQEIGMLRSLGFQPHQVRQIFYFESVFLTGLGCLMGTVLALILSVFFNTMEFTYPSGQFSYEMPFLIEIKFSTYLSGFLILTAVALLASWLAVRKPSQANVAYLLLHSK